LARSGDALEREAYDAPQAHHEEVRVGGNDVQSIPVSVDIMGELPLARTSNLSICSYGGTGGSR
jgi:hypothetical protein